MERRNGTDKPVAIIGAGLTGLVAANKLAQDGVPVIVFEGGKEIGGLARSFLDEEGFSYDFGAHFMTNRLAAAMGISGECDAIQNYGETVLLGGRTYSYPLGLMRRPKFLASAAVGRVRGLFNGQPCQSAADWFRRAYGDEMAQRVAIPLIEAWSGVNASELAPSVAEKLPQSILKTAWLKLADRFTTNAINIGYCREQPDSVHVWHVYPRKGVHMVNHHLAASLEGAIQLESRVEAILVEDGRARAVQVNGQRHDVAAVMSTAPVHILPKLVKGTDALQYLSQFRYRPMVVANLRMSGRNLIPDVVTWTPEADFPFLRLTETPVSVPWMAPPGKTIITVDTGCQVGDEIWAMPDEELAQFHLKHIEPIIPDVRSRYLGCRVMRTPVAYPVFHRSYEDQRLAFEKSTDVPGLYTIGRNGQFAHILMEDIYWQTLKRVRQMLAEL